MTTTGGYTLCDRDNVLDPEGFPSHNAALQRSTHPLWAARPWLIVGPGGKVLRTATACGTDRGRDIHRAHHEPPCDICAQAHRRAQQARDLRAGRRRHVMVTPDTLAALYLNAPPPIQDLLDDQLGTEVCDALVELHDDHNDRNIA